MPAPMSRPDPYFQHWADQAARRTIAAHPDAETFVCAAGITPSGVVHVGNFREIITVDLVVRALRDAGKQVRFIYSWDDFDVFRKVPKGMPQPEMLEQNLRRSIADVPDPFGEHDSYAAHNIARLEASIEPLAIEPEFIRQSKAYRAGAYADGIKTALENKEAIRGILDQHRKTPLAADWLPLAGFCSTCGRDELEFSWSDGYEVGVTCRSESCGATEQVDLRKGGNIKLPWRIDWPMRWGHEKVCFEPGGKDHSSAGGSYDTGKEIVAAAYDWVAPQYVAYDFVRVKGQGGKISSSAGNVVTVADCLEVYEPVVLRWIFASYRPNTEFSISFDLDVIKIYEDYDRAVRLAHQAQDGGRNDKKRLIAGRTMQLASLDGVRIEAGTEPPRVISFRPLTMTLQIFDGDIGRTVEHYAAAGEVTNDEEKALLRSRAQRAWHWIETYAPEEFCYRIRTEPVSRTLEGEPKLAMERMVAALRAVHDNAPADPNAAVLAALQDSLDGLEIGPKEFYPFVYDLLIDRPKGPKLTTLLGTMGLERALPLLEPTVINPA